MIRTRTLTFWVANVSIRHARTEFVIVEQHDVEGGSEVVDHYALVEATCKADIMFGAIFIASLAFHG